MLYITKAKYGQLLRSLEIDLPLHLCGKDNKDYYWGSKLTSFDLALCYFTKSEAKALLISDRLFQDTESALSQMLIKKIAREQEEWVFEIGMPSYHFSNGCELLHNDFTNIRIPSSLNKERIEEYRSYFIDNYKNYGFHEALRDPRILMRTLQEIFELNEKDRNGDPLTIDQMVEYYFRKERYENSEVAEFNATLDFEKEADRIQNVVDGFKQLEVNVSVEEIRMAYFKMDDKNLSQAEREKMAEILKQRKALVARILNFHFRKLFNEGFDINAKLFELVGFQPCKCCGR